MTDYQELYELERKRADMCEGIILELRRQVSALEAQAQRLARDERHAWQRVDTLTDEKNALKRERRNLRKALTKSHGDTQ